MGLWLGIVLTTAWLAFHSYALAIYTRHALPWWATAVGALVGVATMLALAWKRHPALRRSFGAVPLADEVESPPASPGGSTHRT
jgi:endonuclease/exonuclease/phosphatase (EEP) superfamily protein YafD